MLHGQCLQGMLRQFTGGIARQPIDEQQRTRQKDGIDPPSQLIGQLRRGQGGCDHHRGQPAHAGAAAALRVGQKERAVEHAWNGVQLGVQIPEGTALAGDVDQVCGAPVQQKFILAFQFDHIAQGSQLFDVPALREDLIPRRCEPGARPATDAVRRPRFGACGGWRFGRFRWNRRSRAAEYRISAPRLAPGPRPTVRWRTRSIRSGATRCRSSTGRAGGPASRPRPAAAAPPRSPRRYPPGRTGARRRRRCLARHGQQGEQHGRFEAVHMLARNGADHGHAPRPPSVRSNRRSIAHAARQQFFPRFLL